MGRYSGLWYIGSMKVKTSITLSRDLVEAIDRQAASHRSRSEFIETTVRTYLEQKARNEITARDLETINRRADRLNREAQDVLDYQVIP
jgi:metal-responsive CopG/Arc/MetJ family transcriptional regulator